MADVRRIAVAGSIALSLLVTGCGGTPSKADFVSKMRESVGDLDAGLKSQSIDAETGNELITKLLECQYDSIKDDTDLLQKAYDDPGDTEIAPQLDAKTTKCVDEFSTAMAALAGPTTTTTPPAIPETTSVPEVAETTTTLGLAPTTVPEG